MKAILISGRAYSKAVNIVDVKETAKSYMVDGVRFPKGDIGHDGYISHKSSSDAWGGTSALYPIDNEYALSLLDEKRHSILCGKIENRLNKSLTREQAKAIAEILGL